MYGPNGWYGWRTTPLSVGALELWYWSMKPEDRPGSGNAWVEYLEGGNPKFPETVLKPDPIVSRDGSRRCRKMS